MDPLSPPKPAQYDETVELTAPTTASIDTPAATNVANHVEDYSYDDCDHTYEEEQLANDDALNVEENVDAEYHDQEDADLRRALLVSLGRDQHHQGEEEEDEQKEEPAASCTKRAKSAVRDDEEGNHNSQTYSKLRIKVRHPKSGALEEDVGGSSSKVEVLKCEECDKDFTSGKALAGHKRVHVSEKKRQNNKIVLLSPSSKNKRKRGDQENNIQADVRETYLKDGRPTCHICNKNFQTDKSLFGHMRCHPEREWRGMNPPPGFTTKSSSGAAVDDDQQVAVEGVVPLDLVQAISPSWKLTGKRGSNNNRSSDSSCNDYHDQDTANHAAKTLVSMKSDSNRNNDARELYQAAGPPSETVPAPEFDIDDNDKHEEESDDEDDSDTNSDDNINLVELAGRKRLRYRNMQLIDREEEAADDHSTRYTCIDCNRSFPTPQALGGHRSSHCKYRSQENNNNHVNAEVVEEDELEEGEIREDPPETHTAETSTSNHAHRCKTCSEVFPSGQALGGHQRRHWTGQTVPTVTNHRNDQVSTDQNRDQDTTQPLEGSKDDFFPLDLNRTPDNEDNGVV